MFQLFGLLILFVLVLGFVINGEEAVESQNRSGGPEEVFSGMDIDRRLIKQRRHHL